jgi:hypothetical protein
MSYNVTMHIKLCRYTAELSIKAVPLIECFVAVVTIFNLNVEN